jgi:DNA-binding transcriptional ArsR family regulator
MDSWFNSHVVSLCTRNDAVHNLKNLLDKSSCLYKYIPMSEPLHLNLAFAALADPTRRAILARLAKGEATVMELAEPFDMTQPAISQHLRVLEDAGLVVHRVEGAKRPRRLAKAGIDAMDQWLALLRKALEKNYSRLDEVLASMEQINGEKKKGETQ